MGIEGAPRVQRVDASGVKVPVGANALEVSLDIEVVRAVSPRARIVTFEAPLGWTGFVDALRAINADERIDVASVSFGKCLARVEPDVVAAMEQEHVVAVARGKTIFVASGDSGAFSCLHSESELSEASHVESVDWPAASPNVIGVGGTRLSLRGDRSYFAENGWEDTLSNRGTGGGVSTTHKRPSWQRGPGVRNAYSNGGRRQVPDVAGPADCDSAFLIVYPRLGERGLEQAVGPRGLRDERRRTLLGGRRRPRAPVREAGRRARPRLPRPRALRPRARKPALPAVPRHPDRRQPAPSRDARLGLRHRARISARLEPRPRPCEEPMTALAFPGLRTRLRRLSAGMG